MVRRLRAGAPAGAGLSTAPAARSGLAGLAAALATTGVFAAINLVTGLARNKGLAVMLAPAGFGQWSQILSFFYLLQTAAVLGVTTGVTRYVAEYRRTGREPAVVITSALRLVGYGALALALTTAALSPLIAGWVVDDRSWWWVVLVVAAAIPAVSAQAVLQAGLQGVEDYRRLAYASGLGAAGGLAAALAAAYGFGARGVAFFIAGSFALTAAIFARALRAHMPVRWRGAADRALYRGILRYGGVALVGSALAAAGTLGVRSMVLHVYGADANGYYQAMSGLTLQILPVFLSGIGLYVVPKLGGVDDRDEVRALVRRVVRFVPVAVAPLLGLGVVFREAFFAVLFSADFAPAAAWFPVQLTGDLLLALAWAAGSHWLPRGKLRVFLVCEAARAGVLVAVAVALVVLRVEPLGVGALALAHAASYGVEAAVFLWLGRRDMGLAAADWARPLAVTALGWSALLAGGYTLAWPGRLGVWLAASLLTLAAAPAGAERRALLRRLRPRAASPQP